MPYYVPSFVSLVILVSPASRTTKHYTLYDNFWYITLHIIHSWHELFMNSFFIFLIFNLIWIESLKLLMLEEQNDKENLLFFDNGLCYTWHLHYRHINVDILVHWASYFISGFSNKHRPISSTSLEMYFLDNFPSRRW